MRLTFFNKTALRRLSNLLLVTIGSTLLWGCNDQPQKATTTKPQETKSEFTKKYLEVQAIHDEVMPKRSELIRLVGQTKRSSLSEADKNEMVLRLERADSMMMQWMYDEIPNEKLQDSLGEKGLIAYLSTREKDINLVADSMLTTISDAKQLIAQ